MSNLPIQLFNYESNEVRTLRKEDGSIWFVNIDVCKVLEIKNPSSAISKLKENHRGVVLNEGSNNKHELAIVSEAGLYKLVLKSRKKEAESFQDWICEKVLPEIRKTGSYNSQTHVPALPTNFKEALKLLIEKEEQKEKLEKELLQQKNINDDLMPFAVYGQSSLNGIKKVPLSVFGKYLSQKVGKLGRNKISEFLIDKKLLFRNRKGIVDVYSQYLNADSNYQYFNLNPINYKKPVYSISKVNGVINKTKIGEEVVTGFQILILKSGMEKTVELAYKSGLFTNSEYIKVINDLPQWVNNIDYDEVKEFHQELGEIA